MIRVMCFILFIEAPAAFAGWTSGGGELIADAHNPWFLDNTTTVSYCISIDQSNFGLNVEQIDDQFQKALKFWRAQFQTAIYKIALNDQYFHLATQVFVRKSCGDNLDQPNVDLVLQMGILTDTQIRQLPDMKLIAALTIRTGYNLETLAGRGFMYVAPERGPRALGFANLIDYIWSGDSGQRLFETFVHELGHLFGLPHSDSPKIMGERFVHDLVTRSAFESHSRLFEGDKPLFDIFRFRSDTHQPSRCLAPSGVRIEGSENLFEPSIQFYVLDPTFLCVREEVKNDTLYVYASTDGLQFNLIGTAPSLEHSEDDSQDEPLIRFWMPPQAKLLNLHGHNTSAYSVPVVWRKKFIDMAGTYTSLDGKVQRRLWIKTSPEGIQSIGSVMNNRYYFDIRNLYQYSTEIRN